MSLLRKAGQLVIHAGQLVLASSVDCVNLCCGTIWNCCWLSQDHSLGFACKSGACEEGLSKSGPFDTEPACETDCSNDKYYCCINAEGDLDCQQAPFTAGYSALSGPYDGPEQCVYCDDETTGACCGGWDICADNSSTCDPATSKFSKNACGVCEESFPASGESWTKDSCRVYGDPSCIYSSEIGWATMALCQSEGKVWGECQETLAYQCDPFLTVGQTFHPNKQCYEVNCPGDCYDSGQPSGCGGYVGAAYPGPTCLASFIQCDEGVQATISITGAEPPVNMVMDAGGALYDECAATYPNAYQKAADMVNSTFILEQAPPLSDCFPSVTVTDYVDETIMGATVKMGVTVNVALLIEDPAADYPDSNTTPGTPGCGKNICYKVVVTVNIFTCPYNDPPGCSYSSSIGGSTHVSDRQCSALEVLFNAACQCPPYPYTIKCEDYFSTTLHMTGYSNPCTGCADGATASVTIG